jgi:hypothetical protein
MLHYPGLYAGATDLICSHNGMETVVDFKQSIDQKRRIYRRLLFTKFQHMQWLMIMFMVVRLNKEFIMICTPDLYYQEFKIEGIQLRKSKHEFLKRLDMYNELKFSEKEKAKVDTNALLKEFESDKS